MTNRKTTKCSSIVAPRIALAALALTLAVPVTVAQAAPAKVRKARFAVTVEGVQRSTWTTDHQPDGIGGCDGAYHGQGSEKVRFTSSKFSLRALTIPGLSAPVLTMRSKGKITSPEFVLRGSITRNGAISAAPVDNGCGGADGPAVAKDCGVKRFSGLGGKLDYRLRSKPRDVLEVDTYDGEDPFRNCGGGGTQFPSIATRNMGRPMDLRLPRGELFDRKIGKFILVGRAREANQSGEHRFKTTTRWVITLVRK